MVRPSYCSQSKCGERLTITGDEILYVFLQSNEASAVMLAFTKSSEGKIKYKISVIYFRYRTTVICQY